jgi:GAF domain-containing protein
LGDRVLEQRGQEPRPSEDQPLGDLTEFATTGAASTAEPAHLIALATAALPGARHACLTLQGERLRLQTLACTDPVADELDRLQETLHAGPALDVVASVDVVAVRDLQTTGRWPDFARAAVRRGIRSVLSVRVPIESMGVAALTCYAADPDAFGEPEVEIAVICGSFLGLLLRSARERERAVNLEIALETNRRIGIAVGILMARNLLTADQAFGRLRATSQRLHRKVRDIADEVISTGVLP